MVSRVIILSDGLRQAGVTGGTAPAASSPVSPDPAAVEPRWVINRLRLYTRVWPKNLTMADDSVGTATLT